jgi:hypothetical protein
VNLRCRRRQSDEWHSLNVEKASPGRHTRVVVKRSALALRIGEAAWEGHMSARRMLRQGLAGLTRSEHLLMALRSCFSTLPAAAPACIPRTALNGADSRAAVGWATSRSACTSPTSAPCASSESAQRRTYWRCRQPSDRRQPPCSAAVQLTAGAGTTMLLSPSPRGRAAPLARRAASSAPAAGAECTRADTQRAGHQQEPPWRRPSAL